MAPKKGAALTSKLAGEAPWRAPTGEKPIPRISLGSGSTHVRQASNFHYAMSVMKHPDPVGMGLASDAFVEAAGPDCLIPGQGRPIRIMGLQVWPLNLPKINFKALEPIGRELKTFGKLLDRAFDLMQAPFNER